MTARLLRAVGAAILVGVFVLQGGVRFGAPQGARAVNFASMNEIQERLLSGLADLELNPANQQAISGRQPTQYAPRGSGACSTVLSSNVKVNQNCSNVSDPDLQGRGQSQNETSIAQDPNNTNHLIASYNDYRRGDGGCGVSYSLDKGRTWNDSAVPMSFGRGAVQGVVDFGSAREYWQAGGDTSVAFDSKGNAYLSCQVFNRGAGTTSSPDVSSAFMVFRSTQNGGASFDFPGRYVRASSDVTDSGVEPFLDKQLMAVDNNALACQSSRTAVNPGSACTPFQDRVYVTWTEFAADGTAYIYEAYSSDYGETFSQPHLVSGDNPTLCTITYGAGTSNGNCNENQFSQPFVGRDGTLYVVYSNFNNPLADANDNHNQILLSKSVDGGNTFSTPVKVADYYDLPDCATYQGGQDLGRACVPEKNDTNNSIFRATNYASGAVNPTNPAQVVVAFGSYINSHSNEANGCVPTGFDSTTGLNLFTGVKTAGACNNDILVSVSTDYGATFTGTSTDPRNLTSANQDAGQATTDQFWQWITINKTGKVGISYFDRQYNQTGGPSNGSTVPFDEATGSSDISLSGSADYVHFGTQRVTSSPMPPPTQFGGLFYGDYSGLTGIDNAYPLWMDTRNPELFSCPNASGVPAVCTATTDGGLQLNDQDVYTASVAIPTK